MTNWTDANGRNYTCAITVSTMKRVKEATGLNLMETVTGDLLSRLGEDPALFVDVLYAIHRPQCDAAGVTAEQFGEALYGDALDRATRAFTAALVEFLPDPRTRRLMGAALKKAEEEAEEAFRKAEEAMGSGVSLPASSGGVATSAPASSASTPTA